MCLTMTKIRDIQRMKQPTKFKRWFLGLFGGVPKSDYNIVVEQRDNFVGDLKINNLQIKNLEQENELLKNQIAHDSMPPVIIKTENVKLKEIKRVVSIDILPSDQTEYFLRRTVLADVIPFIKTEYNYSNQTATVSLLIAEVQ